MKAAADNDILLKGACYGLLATFDASIPGEGSIGILGTAIFVLPKRIRRKALRCCTEDVEAALRGFIARHEVLEPTGEEQQFAADLEFAAQQMSLPLDAGESQLAAMTTLRSLPMLLTGDKRAIVSLEKLLEVEARLAPLESRIQCLEQLVLRALDVGDSNVRDSICSEPEVDVALSICFSCYSPDSEVEPRLLLVTYVDDLRKGAPHVLAT